MITILQRFYNLEGLLALYIYIYIYIHTYIYIVCVCTYAYMLLWIFTLEKLYERLAIANTSPTSLCYPILSPRKEQRLIQNGTNVVVRVAKTRLKVLKSPVFPGLHLGIILLPD